MAAYDVAEILGVATEQQITAGRDFSGRTDIVKPRVYGFAEMHRQHRSDGCFLATGVQNCLHPGVTEQTLQQRRTFQPVR